jgi:hypothetical protein
VQLFPILDLAVSESTLPGQSICWHVIQMELLEGTKARDP